MDTTGPCTPADNSPDDVVGSPHLHVFARVYRVSNGSDQGRFRWYLNDVLASAGEQLQGIEDTQGKARQAANLHFQQWIKRIGVTEAPVRGKKQLALPFHLNSQPERGKQTPKTKPAAGLHADIDRLPRRMRRYCNARINSSVRQVHLAHLFPRRCRLCQSRCLRIPRSRADQVCNPATGQSRSTGQDRLPA